MLNLCGIVVAILKMATGRNFSMSGINSGHHYLPTFQILMISDNVEFLPPIYLCRLLAANDIFLIASYTGKHSSLYISLPYIFSCSEFVTMQSVHLNLLSVAGLGDFIIVNIIISCFNPDRSADCISDFSVPSWCILFYPEMIKKFCRTCKHFFVVF
jgi:hypothetical protein